MSIFSRLFPKALELEQAKHRIEVLETDKAELAERNKALWASYNNSDATVQKQRTELANLTKKLREQNDADLLLVSARIAIATLKGEKPVAADVALQQNLISQQAALSGYYSGQMSGGGLLGQLGLASALGGVFR